MDEREPNRGSNGRADNAEARQDTATGPNRLDPRTEEEIRNYRLRSKQEITDRINELEIMWDTDRVMELATASVSMIGIGLGTRRRGWLALPVVSLGLLAWQSVRGWSPVAPLFQRLGLRSRAEINREIFALRILRGDFKKAHNKGERPRAQRVIDAVTETGATEESASPAEPIQ